jgi:hypothetical protein
MLFLDDLHGGLTVSDLPAEEQQEHAAQID